MLPASPIDRRSDATVLFYNGGPTPRDVPARDLHGGDLARIAYARAHVDAVGQPKQPTPKQLEALATELSSTGTWSRESEGTGEPPTLVEGDTAGDGPIEAPPIETTPEAPAPPAEPEAAS